MLLPSRGMIDTDTSRSRRQGRFSSISIGGCILGTRVLLISYLTQINCNIIAYVWITSWITLQSSLSVSDTYTSKKICKYQWKKLLAFHAFSISTKRCSNCSKCSIYFDDWFYSENWWLASLNHSFCCYRIDCSILCYFPRLYRHPIPNRSECIRIIFIWFSIASSLHTLRRHTWFRTPTLLLLVIWVEWFFPEACLDWLPALAIPETVLDVALMFLLANLPETVITAKILLGHPFSCASNLT